MDAKKFADIKIRFAQKAPACMFHLAMFFYVIVKKIKMHEERKSYGKLNPDKTFYVIRLYPPATGFLANYVYILGYMKHAFEHDYIPVIDMQNYETLYTEKEPVNGTKNVWEYCFEQPFDVKTGRRYSLDEVYKSKNVILSDGSENFYSCDLERDLDWQIELSKLIPFNSQLKENINKQLGSLNTDWSKVIGVPSRGSEQRKRIIGHNIPATPKQIIDTIEECSNEWYGSENVAIFVKAEEEDTINWFKQVYDKVLYTQATRLKNYDLKKGVAASHENKKQGKQSQYQSLLEYLTDIYILSRCDSLIGSMNNGLYAALIWNEKKYSHVKIIDNGKYK